jgi:hypothetical protein
MVACEINNLRVFCQQARDVFDDLHMRFRPVTFRKLPHIYDVAVKDDSFRLDCFEVPKKSIRVATIGAKMNIG